MTYNPVKFFTATIQGWKPLLKPDKYKNIVTESLKFLVEKKRIRLFGFVVMPNHLHLLWSMQDGIEEKDVQRDFLKFTAQNIKFDLIKNHPKVLAHFRTSAKDREYQFWKRRAYASEMFNRQVVEQKLEYIHNNPLAKKWNLVQHPEDYFYSSARFYLLNIDDWGFLTHYYEHI